jgi:hypothetical protein
VPFRSSSLANITVYNALGQRIQIGGGSAGTVLYAHDKASHLVDAPGRTYSGCGPSTGAPMSGDSPDRSGCPTFDGFTGPLYV